MSASLVFSAACRSPRWDWQRRQRRRRGLWRQAVMPGSAGFPRQRCQCCSEQSGGAENQEPWGEGCCWRHCHACPVPACPASPHLLPCTQQRSNNRLNPHSACTPPCWLQGETFDLFSVISPQQILTRILQTVTGGFCGMVRVVASHCPSCTSKPPQLLQRAALLPAMPRCHCDPGVEWGGCNC
jgi:hypothetical protein